MKTKRPSRRSVCVVIGVGLMMGSGLSSVLQAATATNTQGAGSVASWTNNAVWNASSYPGSAAGESAYLIGNVAGGYTNVLDYTLSYGIATLTLSNAGGEVWLIVTNAALTNTTLNLRNGGRVRIDNAGLVTNTAAFTMSAPGGGIYVNGGGRWAGVAATVGSTASGGVVAVAGPGATWMGTTLGVGSGAGGYNAFSVTDGGTGRMTGAITVGGLSSSYNSLTISNGGCVQSVGGTVGGSATGNWVVVVGSNATQASTLVGGGNWIVGNAGRSVSNWVLVGAGGIMTNVGPFVGYTAGARDNFFIVTNGGCLYGVSGGAAEIGDAGANNWMAVSGTNEAGPSLWQGRGSSLTVGTGNGAWNNLLRIENGAVASNHAAVTVGTGAGAQFNTLIVTNGSSLYSTGAGAIGASSSSNNTVIVAGRDADGRSALWDTGGANVTIGAGSATGNVLRVGDGGVLTNAILTFITPTPNNAVMVASGGAVYAGIYVGNSASLVTNPSIALPDGSLWEPGSTWNGSGRGLYVGNSGSSNSVALNGRTFTNLGSVYCGFGSVSGNRLTISNGAALFATNNCGVGYVNAASGSDNTASIMGGPGVVSVWDGGGMPFTVGYAYGNRTYLTVDGRGQYGSAVLRNLGSFGIGAYIQYSTQGGIECAIVVTNGGVVSSSGGGTIGHSNRLEVVDGGRFEFNALGAAAFSMNGRDSVILVRGTNSVLEGLTPGGNGTHLVIGSGTSGNSLLIENAGVVTGLNATVGSGANAVGNRLSISGGGKMYSAVMSSAIGSGTSFSTGMVQGAESLWDLYGTWLYVGSSGASNALWIVDGATVTNLGGFNYGVGDVALHVGVGSGAASYNQVVITNGGRFVCRPSHLSFVGTTGGGHSNLVLVTGSNSWLDFNGGTLNLGAAATTGNVLRIEDGGVVDRVGTLTFATNGNMVLLNGGTLGVASLAGNNGRLFNVGDGTQSATFKSMGGGTCNFTNGLLVRAGGTLKGIGPAVGGSVVGVVITNGATMSAGMSGPGTLTLGNTTWYGEGTNLVEISDAAGSPGVGFDLINVSTQLTLMANGGKFRIRMDSMGGYAGFQPDQNYSMKIMTYGTSTTLNSSDFVIDTNAFLPGGAWWVTNIGNELYLKYTGATVAVAGYVWNPAMNGNWSVGGNWMAGAPDMGGNATNILEFGGAGSSAYAATNNQGNGHLLNKLLLSGTSTGTNWIGGQSVQFAGSDGGIRLEGSGVYVITNQIGWTEPLTLAGFGVGGVAMLKNTLTGTGDVTVAANGTYTFAASNTFPGNVTVRCNGDGQLRVDHAYGLGTNNVTVSNGMLRANVAAITVGEANQANRCLLVTGTSSIWTNNGTLTLGSGTNSQGHSLTVNAGRFHATTLTLAASNCLVTVTNGGRLFGAVSMTGTNNTTLVSGSGAFASGNPTLSGANNLLRISAGGMATNTALTMSGVSNRTEISDSAMRFTAFSGNNVSGTGGRLVVSGPSANLMNDQAAVNIGYGGTNCELRVADGAVFLSGVNGGWGSVSVGGSAGAVPTGNRIVVDNATCSGAWLFVGNYAYANDNELVVTNGGTCASAGTTYAGNAASNANNRVTICSGCTFLPGTLIVGNAAWCQDNRVTVNGGLMTNVTEMQVGGGATNWQNNVMLTNNAVATVDGANGVRIGLGFGSFSNTFTVAAGSVLNARGYPIAVGVGGATKDNRLMVGNGGTVTNVGTLTVGNPTGTNQLFLSGGSLMVSNLVASNANNTITFSGGTLNLRGAFVSNGVASVAGDGTQTAVVNLMPGGTCLFADGLTIAAKATLSGAGTIQAATTVLGTNSPGAGIGVITNIGNFTLANTAVSRVEIAAYTSPGTGWDLVAVTNGTLTLDGRLFPVLTGGFTPTNTQSYVIMTNLSGTVAGTFLNVANSRVNAYSNDLATVMGSFRLVVSNSWVVLNQFTATPRGATGTTFMIR